MAITITFKSDFINKLDSLSRSSRELAKQLSEQYHFIVEEKFKNEGIPKWHPLSPSTLKQRTKKGYTGKILQRTNMLQTSVMPFNTETHAGVGTNIHYAKIHEYGGTIIIPDREQVINFRKLKRGKGKGGVRFAKEKKAQFAQKVNMKGRAITIPRRSFLELTEADKIELGNFIIQFVNEK